LVTTGLPEGFNAGEPNYVSGPHPEGFNVQRSEIDYQKPAGGQVYCEDQVMVEIFAFDVSEGRAFQLAVLESEGYQWAFEEIAGITVDRYHSEGVDGRIWISGPYTIGIYSGLDVSERGPWVDDFAELYLQEFPAP
jgi:hypothetical protein